MADVKQSSRGRARATVLRAMDELIPGGRELRRMKVVATAFLVAAAVLFVLARSQHSDPEGWGYVEAFAEAAMVGALADWFAVTALFRHPLGIPIPHTAIIPRRKDQIARSLGTFVESNFMSQEVVHERLRSARVGWRLGEWLAEPAHAAKAAHAVSDAIHTSLTFLDDSEVRLGLERAIERKVHDTAVAPLAGRAIELGVEGHQHERLFDAVLQGARGFLSDNKAVLRARVSDESPWWVPRPIDSRLFAKLYEGAERLLDDVQADRDHELRKAAERRLVEFAERLRHDPELRVKGEQLKAELLAYPDVRAWMGSLWDEVKGRLVEASGQADGELQHRIATTLARLGARLRDEPELQARVDDAIERFVSYVVVNYRHEVTALIESTIAKWDPATTSRRIELQIGRDLQFIRINGTVVGGLAGVVIHTFSELAL